MTVVARLRRPPHRGRVPPQSVVSVTSRGSVGPSRAPSLDRKEAVLCVIPSFEMTAPSRFASGAVDSASGARSTTGAAPCVSAPDVLTRSARTFTDPERTQSGRRHKGKDQRQRQNELHGDGGTTSGARRPRINDRQWSSSTIDRFCVCGHGRRRTKAGEIAVWPTYGDKRRAVRRNRFTRPCQSSIDEGTSRDPKVVLSCSGGTRHEPQRAECVKGKPGSPPIRSNATTQTLKPPTSDQSSMHHPNNQAAASMFGAVRMADLPSSYRPRFSPDTMTSIVE
jgi:hypothetical protein